MATNDTPSTSLADRLLSRFAKGRQFGAGSRLFERFGIANPYDGGSVSDASQGEGRFSFLNSAAYYDELRGLSRVRRHLMWRIASIRQQARVGERLHEKVATRAVRAATFDEGTLINWGSQVELPVHEEAVAAQPVQRHRPVRRQSAVERALRADVAKASDVLSRITEIFDAARMTGGPKVPGRSEIRALSRLPEQRQAGAARRLVRGLRGVAAVAARGTEFSQGSESTGQRPLAVAQARQADDRESKGLRRVLADSPIVMTLEQPEPIAPQADEPAGQREAARPRVRRPHAHRRRPVAAAARDARNQASAGRAGPPVSTSPPRSEPERVAPRPTERMVRVATQIARTPFVDVRRGFHAAGRSPAQAVSQGRSFGASVSQALRAPASQTASSSPFRTPAGQTASSSPFRTPAGQTDPPPTFTRDFYRGEDSEVAWADAPSPSIGPAARIAARSGAGLPDESGLVTAITSYINEDSSSQAPLVGRAVGIATPEMALPKAPVANEAVAEGVVSALPSRQRSSRRPTRASSRRVPGRLPAVARAIQRSQPSAHRSTGMGEAGLSASPVSGAFSVEREALTASAGTISSLPDAASSPLKESRSVRLANTPDAMTLAQPAPTPDFDAAEAPSAQRSVVSQGKSRRARALPTVRAAARALSQERAGIRGRLLSPSTSAHVRVVEASHALGPAIRVEAGATRPVRAVDSSQQPEIAPLRRGAQGRESSVVEGAGLLTYAQPERSANQPEADGVARLGPVARASTRSNPQPRVRSTGALSTPKTVAPFISSELPESSSAHTEGRQSQLASSHGRNREVSLTARTAPRTSRDQAPSSPAASGSTREFDASPETRVRRDARVVPTQVLARPVSSDLAEEVHQGLAARATERTPRRQRVLRSALPAATPERKRAEARQHRAQLRAAQNVALAERAGATQLHKTPIGETEGSQTHRTPAGHTVRSKSVRTPAGWTERSVAFRTLSGFTPRSGTFRTNTIRHDPSVTFRTGTPDLERSTIFRAGRALDAEQTLVQSTSQAELPLPMEGGVARAMRRAVPNREAVSDSGVTYLSPREVHAPVDQRSQEATPQMSRPASRALARSTPRRNAGSVVPHPATTERATRAATRMLGAAPGSFAAHEGVLVTADESVEYANPSSTSTASAGRILRRKQVPESRKSRGAATNGPEDGLVFASPRRESISGGESPVAPAPGSPSRSRMQQALRAATATVGASSRTSETVLTLPSTRRAAQGGAGRRFEATLQLDEKGRLTRSSVVDSMSGRSLEGFSLPSATEWAEAREEVGSADATKRSSRSALALQDDGETFVPAFAGTEGVHNPHGSLTQTLATLQGGGPSDSGKNRGALGAGRADNRAMVRHRSWSRRGMAAEMGMLAPVLADADFAPQEAMPEEAPSWARRAVAGTSVQNRNEATNSEFISNAPEADSADKRDAPGGLMAALARADSPEDLVKIVLERGAEAERMRNELPTAAARMVEKLARMPSEVAEAIQSGSRLIEPSQNLERNVLVPHRRTRQAKSLTQLSTGHDGLAGSGNRMMKLADKLLGLIHLAEHSRKSAQDEVRMSKETQSMSVEGGQTGKASEKSGMSFIALEEALRGALKARDDANKSRLGEEDPDGGGMPGWV